MATSTLTGGCLCNKITYQIENATPKIAICHCNTCKRHTGSGFSTNMIVPKPFFKYTSGTPKIFLDTSGDSGQEVPKHFCGDCGTALNVQPNDKPIIVVRAGTINERDELDLAMEIFHQRKDKFVDQIGQVPALPGMP
ncbi:Mss4-like protein [Aspergillus avenaceus]|uniref:Mss4-like protein n=1 Tax=Aspergillus avenaceus TaxID=36643 RepID=A0A5N6U9M7_ASPAV|nr:Mss4-like protein [Aspergillus avenaceus]